MNKNELAGLKGELRKYLNLLKEELKKISDEKIDEVNSEITGISDFHSNIFDGDDSLEKQINSLISKLENYNERYNDIIEYYGILLNGDDENNSIKEDIEKVLEEIKNYKLELIDGENGNKSIKEKINNSFIKIKEYYDFIYGIEEDKDENGEIVKEGKIGYKEKLDKLYLDKVKEYGELKKQIEGLLPGATSAGLSSSYKDLKNSFDDIIKKWERVFVLTILGLSLISLELLFFNGGIKDIKILLLNSPIYLPLIWLAYFSSKQQSQNKRLQQEYAYKESLAKSFEGYKNQIDNLGNDEKSEQIKKLLMENIVKMTGYNPSITLDKNHGTKPPIFEYLFGSIDKKGQ